MSFFDYPRPRKTIEHDLVREAGYPLEGGMFDFKPLTDLENHLIDLAGKVKLFRGQMMIVYQGGRAFYPCPDGMATDGAYWETRVEEAWEALCMAVRECQNV